MYFLQKVTEEVADFRKISPGIFLNSDSRLPHPVLKAYPIDFGQNNEINLQEHGFLNFMYFLNSQSSHHQRPSK